MLKKITVLDSRLFVCYKLEYQRKVNRHIVNINVVKYRKWFVLSLAQQPEVAAIIGRNYLVGDTLIPTVDKSFQDL